MPLAVVGGEGAYQQPQVLADKLLVAGPELVQNIGEGQAGKRLRDQIAVQLDLRPAVYLKQARVGLLLLGVLLVAATPHQPDVAAPALPEGYDFLAQLDLALLHLREYQLAAADPIVLVIEQGWRPQYGDPQVELHLL